MKKAFIYCALCCCTSTCTVVQVQAESSGAPANSAAKSNADDNNNMPKRTPHPTFVEGANQLMSNADMMFVAQGLRLANKNNVDAARKQFDRCTSLVGVNGESLVNVIGAYQACGFFDRAIAIANQAIDHPRKKPELLKVEMADLLRARAKCYLDQSRRDEAAADFIAAAKFDPQFSSWDFREAANQRRLQKRFPEALKLMDQAKCDWQLKNPRYYFGRAMIYEDMGRYKDAVAEFSTALSLIKKQQQVRPGMNTWLLSNVLQERKRCYVKLGDKKLADADEKAIHEFGSGWESDVFGAPAH